MPCSKLGQLIEWQRSFLKGAVVFTYVSLAYTHVAKSRVVCIGITGLLVHLRGRDAELIMKTFGEIIRTAKAHSVGSFFYD